MLALATLGANAQMIGSAMEAKSYYPDLSSVDSDSGVLTIANGTSFAFSDTIGFGTYMPVTFGDSQIRLTNLFPGIYTEGEFTGVEFTFLSGLTIGSVSIDAASSPLFAPGSVLSWTDNTIRLNLSNTCAECIGMDLQNPGESIYLNVVAVPEPTTMALLGAGLAGIAWRRRKVV